MNSEITFPRALGRSLNGYGVFATRDIEKGEIIEICPTLTGAISIRAVGDYTFGHGGKLNGEAGHVLALGLCSLYNHHPNPSAVYESPGSPKNPMVGTRTLKQYVADRKIKQGEEIYISYGESWWEHKTREQNFQPSRLFLDNFEKEGSSLIFRESKLLPGTLGIFTAKSFAKESIVDVCPTIHTISSEDLDYIECTSISNLSAEGKRCEEDCSGRTCYKSAQGHCKRCYDNPEFVDSKRKERCADWRGYECKIYPEWPIPQEVLDEVHFNCPWTCGFCDLEERDRTYVVLGNCFVYAHSESEANIEMRARIDNGRKIFDVFTLREIEADEEFVMKPIKDKSCKISVTNAKSEL